MLTYKGLRAEVRAAATTVAVDAALAATDAEDALVPFSSGAALADCLDSMSPYSIPRDRVLVALLLRGRMSRGEALRLALLYAALPAIRWVVRELVRRRGYPSEDDWNDAVEAVLLAIDRFDPATRSDHVLAGIQKDAYGILYRRWLVERGTYAAQAAFQTEMHGVPLKQRGERIADLLSAERPLGARLEGHLIRHGEELLMTLVECGVLTADEHALIVAHLLRRETATALALRLDIDRRTVVRRLDRIIARTRKFIEDAIHSARFR